jgi:hypothetical protein
MATQLVDHLRASGVRASVNNGFINIIGETWKSLREAVVFCERMGCEITRVVLWELSWEEAFAQYLRGLRDRAGGKVCMCRGG